MTADFFDLLKTRRAVRNYQDKDVSLDLLMEIIQDACLAPSGGNRQTWRFIVINNRDTIGRLSEESRTNLVADLDSNPHPRPSDTKRPCATRNSTCSTTLPVWSSSAGTSTPIRSRWTAHWRPAT